MCLFPIAGRYTNCTIPEFEHDIYYTYITGTIGK